STHINTSGELAGLHRRLTVIPASANERPTLAEQIARLVVRATSDVPTALSQVLGPADFAAACREAAVRRVEEHERVRNELASKLRRARELQAATANRRDDAAARARRRNAHLEEGGVRLRPAGEPVAATGRTEAAARAVGMSAHLEDGDALRERAGELTNAAEEARRNLEARRADVETARSKLALVEEQREAAARTIEDAARQLRDLEISELDETTLRRELENANQALQEAEQAHAEALDNLRALEQQAAARAATRDHILQERAALVARLEAPLPDTRPIREALEAFDADTQPGE